MRSYAVELVRNARVGTTLAKEFREADLHRHFATAYGIFAGLPVGTARLVFTAHRAQWVAEELWHPGQVGEFLADGRYQLDIPYSDSRELVMDILKNGADVEVSGPTELRYEVENRLKAALDRYRS